MKKRILSLILAFAMAATLAPATALVGSSVSEAAVVKPRISASYKIAAGGESSLELSDDAGLINDINDGGAGNQKITFSVLENATGNINSSGTIVKYGEIKVENGTTDGKSLLDTNSEDLVTAPTTLAAEVGTGNSLNPKVTANPGVGRGELSTGDLSFTTPAQQANDQYVIIKITTTVDELKANGDPSDNELSVVKYAKFKVAGTGAGRTTTAPNLSSDAATNPVEIEIGSTHSLAITDAEAGNAADYITFDANVSKSVSWVSVDEVPMAKRTGTANQAKTTSTINVGSSAPVGSTFSVTYVGKLNGTTASNSNPLVVNFKVIERKSRAVNTPHYANGANGTLGTASSAATITVSNLTGADLFEDTDAYAIVTRTAGKNLRVSWTIDGIGGGSTADSFKVPASNYAAGSFTIPALTFNKTSASQSGKFTYEIQYYVTGRPVGTPYTVNFTTEAPEVVTLNADGGVISDANYELNDSKMYVGYAAKNGVNWDVYLPIPRKEGYNFVEWQRVTTGAQVLAKKDAPDTITATYADLQFKAVYSKNVTYNLYSGIGTGGKGQDDNKRWGYELEKVELGKAISEKVPFTRNGYTFMGWSTEPNATVALWPSGATMTNEVLMSMEAAGTGNDLYAVWSAKSYTINFIPNAPSGGKKLTTYKDVAPITKKFGAVWSEANLPGCTFAFEGYTFSHWSAVVSGETTDSKDSVVLADGTVTDESLGNKNGDKDITLRAIWVGTGASTLNKNDSEVWTTKKEGETLPLTTNEIGRVVKEWKKQDGSVSEPGSDKVGPGANVYTPEYGKYINYEIEYDGPIAAISYTNQGNPGRGFKNIQKSNSDQESFTIEGGIVKLSAMTADAVAETSSGDDVTVPAVFKGYFFVFRDSDGAWHHVTSDYKLTDVESEAMITTTFDSKKMAALLDAAGNGVRSAGGNYVSNTQLQAWPVFAAKVTGAKVDPDKIELKYGTPLSVVVDQGLINGILTGNSPATSSPVNILPVAGGSDYSIKVANNGGYNPIPEKDTTYTVTYRITPFNTVSSSAAFFDKTVKVTVHAVEDADVDKVFGLEYGPLKNIDLPKGSNVYDVYAALSKAVNIFPVKASNKNTYNVDLAKVDTNVAGSINNPDWKVVIDGVGTAYAETTDVLGVYSKHSDPEGENFASRVAAGASSMREALPSDTSYTFVVDMSNYARLSFQSRNTGSALDYDSKYAYIQVNIGSGSDPTFVPAEPDKEEEDPERPVIKAGPVYRLYNPHNGDHLFTTSKGERNILSASGWQVDAVTFNTPSSSDENAKPVYRVYNPNSGEHFYTMSKGERNKLVSVDKWQYEGVEFYAYSTESTLGVPVYRLWSPASRDAGSHHITGSKGEYNYLGTIGWVKEGVGFRAVKAN